MLLTEKASNKKASVVTRAAPVYLCDKEILAFGKQTVTVSNKIYIEEIQGFSEWQLTYCFKMDWKFCLNHNHISQHKH